MQDSKRHSSQESISATTTTTTMSKEFHAYFEVFGNPLPTGHTYTQQRIEHKTMSG